MSMPITKIVMNRNLYNKEKLKNSVSSPALKKEGPCGGVGQPSCEEELINVAKKAGANKSYLNSIKLEDAGKIFAPGGQRRINPGNALRAINNESKRRARNIINDPGYKTLTENKNARPIVSKVDKFLRSSNNNIHNATNYMLPTLKEAGGLLNIGRKYASSENIMEDISLSDKAIAVVKGWKLINKYPNLKKIANREVGKAKKNK